MNDFSGNTANSTPGTDPRSHGWFARAPLRLKLTLMISTTAGLALFLAVVVSIMQERQRYDAENQVRLASLAQIVGQNSQAAILFQDMPAMERSLNLLAQDLRILMAALYDSHGQRLASYNREAVWQAPVKVPVTNEHGLNPDYHWLSRIIYTAGQEVGAIWIATDTADWQARQAESIRQAMMIFVVLVMLVILLSVRLQRSITGPIEELQRTTNRIIESEDYSLRATAISRDELADVVHGFNHMLDLIQARAQELNQQISIRRNAEALLSEQKLALQRAHDELESRVTARTRELEATRDLAQRANQAKTEFLTNISHELRTPMNAIIGYTELLLEEAQESGLRPDAQADVGRIQHSAQHLLALIEEILDFSRIEAGKSEPQSGELDLHQLISDCIDHILPHAAAAGNRIVNDTQDTIGTIHSDASKVRQILINLLTNACKFTANGNIHLHAIRYMNQRQQEWVLISVSDTGIGMTADTMSQIFEPFRQSDNQITRRYGGAGLGLTIARGLAELLGGRIEVDSVADKGSTFTLHLPASQNDWTRAKSEPDPLHNRLIVAVTDNPASEQALRELAAESGILLRTCSNQNELSAIIDLSVPELLLIDLELGDLNGWKIYRQLKTDSALHNIPTVLADLDSRSVDQSPEEIVRLSKPVQPDILKALIAQKCPGDRALSVLVVEDDREDRAVLSGLLQEIGHHAIEAEDGIMALSLARQTFPDLILLDIALPYKSGLDVLAELRTSEKLGETPVIIVSRSEDLDGNATRLSMHRRDVLFRGAVHPRMVMERSARILREMD